MTLPVEVFRVTPDDWQSHRNLRLAMLTEAPDAFWTTHAEVADLSEEQWRERIGAQCHFQARLDGMPVGSAGAWASAEGVTTLVAMYVAPVARGCGVGELLIAAVREEAARQGSHTLALEVASNNLAARRLYERTGFGYTGVRRPHPRRPGLEELEMAQPVSTLLPIPDPDVRGCRP